MMTGDYIWLGVKVSSSSRRCWMGWCQVPPHQSVTTISFKNLLRVRENCHVEAGKGHKGA